VLARSYPPPSDTHSFALLCVYIRWLVFLIIFLELVNTVIICVDEKYGLAVFTFMSIFIYTIAASFTYTVQQQPQRLRPVHTVITSENEIKCQICWESILSRKYIKPDPSVSLCVCTDFIVCEICFNKIDGVKCPFCRMALIV
jgi:hypothetical protein